ncbi:MAG: type I-C CRISPR-associated protein Cas8c/Csd1 [Planctomycetaceae bacterium]
MILQALNTYYQRLEADPNVDVAPFGFSRQKISFCVVLNDDGSLHEITPETDGDSDKPQSKQLIVPGGAKPPGAGVNPCFLWDNTGYMLGFKPDDEKPDRTIQTFEAFRQKHQDLKVAIADSEFHAVCKFLSTWDPTSAVDYETLTETTSGFGVFRVRGQTHYVHERPVIHDWWIAQVAGTEDDSVVIGQCLLSGEIGPLARLHEPKIKGVAGAQSAGASLVSFNEKAYESYGREQSYNSPVSEAAAFQYGTALNQLLRSENGRRIQIGDATTVFWTESPSPLEDVFACLVDPGRVPAEDAAQKNRLRSLLHRIAAGEDVSKLEIGDEDTQFYVLGLSPNAARLSVRFWYVTTLRGLMAALRQHFTDLEIDCNERDRFPAVRQLLRETAREAKDIPPLLSGAVMRAVLTGAAYPQMLFAAVLRRIRADREVRSVRAAILKAFLNRTSRLGTSTLAKEITMSLDPDRPEASYQLGRLFAELEKTQEDALPGINDTIKDRYFSAASATPGTVFPRIIRMSQHHLRKLDHGSKIHRERQIQEICGRFDDFPSHLNLNNQGLFALGYYHQRQAIFTKRTKPEEAPT